MRSRFFIQAVVVGLLVLAASGCVKRTILVESDPPGAKVWINENQMDEVTPLTYEFITHGNYTFRLRKTGFQEVIARERVQAPIYQWIPLDFFFEFLLPVKLEDHHAFNYALTPEPIEERLMLETPTDRKALITQLSDSDPQLRERACLELAKARDPSAGPEILRVTDDENSKVRRAALIALRSIEGKKGMNRLLKALSDDPSPQVRWQAATELEALGDLEAVPELIKALRDRAPLVRGAAAEALKGMPDERATQPLIRALRDKDTTVRRAATEGLGKIQDPISVKPLTRMLFHKDFQTRRRAVKSLQAINDPTAAPALVRTFKDWDPIIRNNATQTLIQMGNTEVTPKLIRYLRSWKPVVRQHAAQTLGGLKDLQAVEPLERALDREPNPTTRAAMVRALRELQAE